MLAYDIMMSMNAVIAVDKPVGMTPLEAIHALRAKYPIYSDKHISFAGRLDPLAHGVLLLMVGDASKDRAQYLTLEKTYEFEVLFGLETDTYDVMGLLCGKTMYARQIADEKIRLFINNHIGTFIQSYPPYSSKPVNGKPLFWWAKQNRLSEIIVPTREVTIHQFELVSYNTIDKYTLQKRIHAAISKVHGDFRQMEIIKCWDILFASLVVDSFKTATFRIHCSSGTYVRSLSHELGQYLKTGAIALEIKRTKIGNYTLSNALQITRTH